MLIPTYFLPPNVVVSPPRHRWDEMNLPDSPKYVSQAAEYFQGARIDTRASDNAGGITIGGTFYRSAYWHEVDAAAQTAITNAGYGARLYTRDHPGQLPGEIDAG